MGLTGEEFIFFEYYAPQIEAVTMEEIFEWLPTLSEEDRIKAHAFSLKFYEEGLKETRCQK